MGSHDPELESSQALAGFHQTAQRAELVASTVTYPHEVLRTRMQFDQGKIGYGGVVDAARHTIRTDGLKGLWCAHPNSQFAM